MTLSDYKGKKTQSLILSCLYSPNPELKLKSFNQIMHDNLNNILDNKLTMTYESSIVPIRGILLLPKNTNDLISKQMISILNKPCLHMCCLNKTFDGFNSHLLDSDGILIDKKIFDINDLVAILVSTYIVLNSKVISQFDYIA